MPLTCWAVLSGNLWLVCCWNSVIQGKNLSVRAGGGIVYDSDPESEYQESLNKAMSIMKAVEEMD